MALAWCLICSTRHSPGERECPGELVITEAERHGWQVNVKTPHGVEAYGVLVAPTDRGWRARILTYPNVLWAAPGGKTTMKFAGATARDAESRAVAFIRGHCLERGLTVLKDVPRIVPGQIDPEASAAALGGEVRWIRNEHHVGRAPGMGVFLADPSERYLACVRALD